MASRKEIEELGFKAGRGMSQGPKALAEMARALGYRDPLHQGDQMDLNYFFDDNPGACQAVVEWVLEHHDLDEDDDEDEDDTEEDEEEDT